MTKVINLFAGPGAGKSTNAAGIFYEMKSRGINCELVTEYAKDCVWEDRYGVLQDQIYVFGKQHHRLWKLQGKVDYVITDSPLYLSYMYANSEDKGIIEAVVRQYASKMDNINIFVERTKKYNPIGRMQTEEQAKTLDDEIKGIVHKFSRFDFTINSTTPINLTVDKILEVK